MDGFRPPIANIQANNHPPPPSAVNTTSNLSAAQTTSKPSTAPAPPSWPASAMPMPLIDSAPNFPQFSASTAAILSRLQASRGDVAGSLAFEAKKAEVMQNYVTSDKLPTPPPIANTGKRGKGGGRIALKTDVGGAATPTTGATPTSARGSGRGRGRGRGGRSGGRGGKRKRADSVESDVRWIHATLRVHELAINAGTGGRGFRYLIIIYTPTHENKIRPQREQTRCIRAHNS